MNPQLETPKLETKATGDLQQAKADFAATFAAFREANDNRLAALEAKSSVDPLLTEKVDRLNAALETQTRRIENLTLAQAVPSFAAEAKSANSQACLLYTSPSPRDQRGSRMPSSA